MSRIQKKLLFAGVILAGSVAYLAYAGIAAGRSYYLSVDAYVSDPRFRSQRVRLHGVVAADELSLNEGGMGVDFQLAGQSGSLRVVYRGVVPDLFKPGGDVVVAGRMDGEGFFRATELLTKCAFVKHPR